MKVLFVPPVVGMLYQEDDVCPAQPIVGENVLYVPHILVKKTLHAPSLVGMVCAPPIAEDVVCPPPIVVKKVLYIQRIVVMKVLFVPTIVGMLYAPLKKMLYAPPNPL